LPEASIHLFQTYFFELQRWNRTINLTALSNEKDIIIKHFIDSIAALKIIETPCSVNVLDVGAGAGFPALPLKLVRPQISISLLEPNHKKSAFLRYMIGLLNIQNATVITQKLEDYVNQPGVLASFDYIVVRAYNVNKLGPTLASLLRDTGRVILFRSAKVDHNFTLRSLALIQEVEYELPSGYGHRALSAFSKQIS
ncbi:MAG TPA: 16S rRNA (guanine(527)-N(7))-methyltransferase RsmG, partial [Nitrospira sp.]|nr:16S rRNA (guanine(527)-N(7))-methyltransferase RsmG [Nitrospira sp.]